jgi:predicted kinase
MKQASVPLLVVFGGLPGTGKTTLSQALAARLAAAYLRIDTIEQAMRAAGAEPIGAAGYAVANAVAASNLLLGLTVVADGVNPVRESRQAWRQVAARASAHLVDIQLVCSDAAEHRRRIETRVADIPGHVLPCWEAVLRHDHEPRDDEHLLLDTAFLSPAELLGRCEAHIRAVTGGKPALHQG